MTQIKSRPGESIEDITARIRRQEMIKLAEAVADELDMLEDKISDFLEMRITYEFDELRDDIQTVKGVNDALMEENMRLRDELTKVTLDNLKLSAIIGLPQ